MLIIVCFVIGGFFGYIACLEFSKSNIIDKTTIQYKDSIKYDTILRVIKPDNIYITKKSDTTFINNTDTIIYETPAFIDSVTVLLNKDTLSSTYKFPERQFSHWLRRHEDTVKLIVRTIYIPYEKDLSWYEKSSFVIPISFVSGFLTKALIK
jgi:hypothetical protein